jgi:hypothetical protein
MILEWLHKKVQATYDVFQHTLSKFNSMKDNSENTNYSAFTFYEKISGGFSKLCATLLSSKVYPDDTSTNRKFDEGYAKGLADAEIRIKKV